MRAFPGAFGVMTIVGADRALEVCFLLELAGTFPSDLVGPRRRSQDQNTPHGVRSVLVNSEVGWSVPFARKGTRKIALSRGCYAVKEMLRWVTDLGVQRASCSSKLYTPNAKRPDPLTVLCVN